MPSINRIRVNNVKYNFGTQAYDDFTMRLYGQNTLYDLANGGGKSVLMLLLMQCMIPNCTLDDKQPLEKLFRENCGNTTIHSLVEWKLDAPDVKDGMRYMTTGFCARKARDRSEEESREVASVEYFNYCIFYQEYNKYDIINLPLSEGSERMTYQALKNYLHDLARRENRVEVFVFDRKGEYQRFISRYGIIESQWEIVRGINKTEGHVRTYFETNYRTTRKVVEDLLIEEIIEKAYLVKTEQEEAQDHSAAALLMSIREQLKVLAEKKRDITNFDHEAELIALLRDRIQSFSGLYGERAEYLQSIGEIYLTLDAARVNREETQQRLQNAVDEAEQKADTCRAQVEILKTSKKERELEQLREQEEHLRKEAEQAAAEIQERENRLNRRRAELDYLDYLEENKKLQGLIAEAEQEAPVDIVPVVAGIRVLLSKEAEQIQRKLERVDQERRATEAKLAEGRKLLTDARIELAVVRREIAESAASRKQDEEESLALTQKLGAPSLTPPELQMAECREQVNMERRSAEALRKEAESEEARRMEMSDRLREQEAETKRLELAVQNWKEAAEERDALRKRQEEICRIYHAEEDPKGAVYRKLSRDEIRLAELQRELLQQEKRAKEIRNGRLVEMAPDVEKVLSYIATRHGITALFGADYLAGLDADTREKLLLANPELPYGIITRDYETLAGDRNLTSMEVGSSVVRIYDMNALDESEEVSEHRFAVRHSRAFFLEEETPKRLLTAISDLTENGRTEMNYLKEAIETERSDLEFLLTVSERVEEEDPAAAYEKAKEACDLLRKELQEMSEAAEERKAKLAGAEAAVEELEGREEILQQILALQKRMEQAVRQESELERREKTLLGSIQEKEKEEAGLASHLTELQESGQMLSAEGSRIQLQWREHYEAYDKKGAAPAAGTLEELEGRFRSWKKSQAGVEELASQRQLLRTTVEDGIHRLLRSIRERRVAIEDLEKAEILPGDRGALRAEEEALHADRQTLEQKRRALQERSAEVQHLAGSVEYAIENIRAAFGEYESVSLSVEDLEREIPMAEEAKEAAKKALTEARDAFKEYTRQSRESEGLFREAGRLVERYQIDLSKAVLRTSSESELQRDFEEVLLRLDRNEKSLERARNQMLRTKGQVTQTLMDLGAVTLSVSVRDDADIPGSRDAADALAKRLTDMEELIRLERSRVEQGLTDMERLKENFVEQCVERCLDVRTELEKLPRLSMIQMQGEQIQMIKLSIPYVKDEFLRQRMSDYIDRIVEEADTKKSEAEQHRYLQSELALKRIFGVIVSDMNKIRLQLYKRERIREQSRYLKYEEAVGSTGQSQGIYIQFLVSVINYISGMYAMQEGESRSKTIFIDNPFGAAKDIYIWEPIFELLRTNRVQLIVPSRGATPEITGCFDVNYVLGQQMTGGRALTVVSRYNSRSTEEMTEYRELQYEQATLEFI